MKRGVRASFGHKLGRTNDFADCEILRKGHVTEVSILSPGVESAEPLAQVLTVRPTEKPKPSVIRRSHAPVVRRITPADEIEEFIRRMEWNLDVPAEVILENMKRELKATRRRR